MKIFKEWWNWAKLSINDNLPSTITESRNGISRGDHFRFDFYKKKSNQTKFFFKKTETGLNRPFSVWFGLGFLDKNRFKPVWLSFFGLARLFQFGLVLARFGSVFFPVWVQFSFFGFRLIKPKPNRTVFSKF
jgi:hypothetical protein